MIRWSSRCLVLLLVASCGGGEVEERAVHRVELGEVAQEAVAVGEVGPRVQVPVHPNWGGVVTRRLVELGDRVEAGTPLLEVRPLLTDQDRLRIERQMTGAEEGFDAAAEIASGSNLMGWAMRAIQGRSSMERLQAGAERSRADAELQQKLMLEGQAELDGLVLDWVVRAPIAGRVVELPVELGQPVTPASTFGAGTLLLTIADLDRPVFRGTVDELDAGRLAAGMPAQLELGALPGVEVAGELRQISLLAGERNGATVFDVVLDVVVPEDVVLRAGYSAVARIAVRRAQDVAVLPERLVDYREDGAFVLVEVDGGPDEERRVEVGASDGLTVAVLEGLAEGENVLEPGS